MSLYFITGNQGKLAEAKALIPGVEGLDLDLPEIQDIDAHKIVQAKLKEAFTKKQGVLIVEDTSLYLECLNGLPGPLIKWFLKTIGTEGLHRIAQSFGNYNATARTIVGYASDAQNVQFFEGEIKGTIVEPRGEKGFGWDSVFQPEGQAQTFAEMGPEGKNKISMRRKAFTQLAEFLQAGNIR